MTIKETQLAEQDINVLTLYRGSTVIPNPRPDRVLEPEDKLLCFGKLEYMRSMVPRKTRKQRRPELKELVSEEISTQEHEQDVID